MDLGIAGRRALVIGGSANLGLACARALAAEGVRLILFARNQSALDVAADDIRRDFDVEVETFAGDLTSEGDIKAMSRRIEASGGLDIIVLNSPRPPMPMRDVLDEGDLSRWRHAYEGVVSSAVSLVTELVPILVSRRWGRVIAITSASVRQPMRHHALSTVQRAGLTALLKHLANEVAAMGVTVNCVAPAGIATDGLRRDWDVEERLRVIPMARFGHPRELAAAVAFFASEWAGFTTGATLPMDGGFTASLL